MALTNDILLNKIHLVGSNSYQQRIPLATKNNIEQVAQTLDAPENRALWNEFAQNLVNVIGTFAIRDYQWTNPLKEFKQADVSNGLAIEEIAVDLIKASGYDPEDNNIFKRNRADVHAVFHTINDQRRYDITVNRNELKRAFNTPTGLSDFVIRLLSVPVKSSELDEYLIMKELIAISDAQTPIYNIQSVIANPASPTADELKTLSYNLRVAANHLTLVPKGLYNYKGVPTVSKPEDLVIFTTPETSVALDVNVLADAFHTDKTDFVNRVVLLDEMPIDAHAILADKNWFVSGDFVNEITNFFNPKSLEENYYLHRWSVYSTSPFMNIVKFSNSATSTTPQVTVTLDGIAGAFYVDGDSVSSVSHTDQAHLIVTPSGTITPDTPDFIVPGEYTTEITAYREVSTPAEDPEDPPVITQEPVKLGSKTRIDGRGRLFISDTVPVGTKLVVKIDSAYINPVNGQHSELTDTVIVTVA